MKLTRAQQESAVDLMAERGYPFDVAVAKVLGTAAPAPDTCFELGEKALEDGARRGYVKRVK